MFSAQVLPSSDDITVFTSNLSPPSAPCVKTVADDDPQSITSRFSHIGRDSLLSLDNGRETTEFADFDDFENFATDEYDDELCTRPFAIELNAIDIQCPFLEQSCDVLSTTSDDEESTVKDEIPSGVASSKTDEAPTVEDDDDDDPDVVRAQIDSGAFASCTDQRHMLHNFREFTASFPCPVVLQPASDGSDIVPKGVGYLHVPSPNAQGHIAVRTFYHPSLRTTVIDERDFLRFDGQKPKDFSGDRIKKLQRRRNVYIPCISSTAPLSRRLHVWYPSTWQVLHVCSHSTGPGR